MSLSHDQASESLKEIERTARTSAQAYSYSKASPYFILWGLLWVVGYGGTVLDQRVANWIWIGIGLFGSFASWYIGSRSKSDRPSFSWRIFVTWLAAMGAIASIFAILHPVNGMQFGAFFPLVIGWTYVVMGVWLGLRLSGAGLAVVALTLFGFFGLTPAHFMLWMAFVGGATLVGTGLWLRRL